MTDPSAARRPSTRSWTRSSTALRRVGPVGVLLAALALAGCSEEPPPVDTTSISSLQAGAPDRLAAADVDVVALTEPAEVRPDAVSSALGDAGLSPAAIGSDQASALSISAEDLTGLPALVGDVADPGTSFVAVVFAQPADAWVFAAGRPEVFADGTAESGRAAFLAGPVVAYASTSGGEEVAGDVRRALVALVTDAGGTPSSSPSSASAATPSDSPSDPDS